MDQLSHLNMTTGKTITLTIWIFITRVMSLLFNMLSRIVIAFLPRSECLNFMAAVPISSDFGAQENKICHYFQFFTSICMKWWDQMLWSYLLLFWMLSFKVAFSLSSLTFIKRLFSSSSLSAIKLVSSEFLRLLIFLLVVLIPTCNSSSPTFCMKLNKLGWHYTALITHFPILKQSVVPCPVLTVASWPASRFLRRQIRWSGIPVF